MTWPRFGVLALTLALFAAAACVIGPKPDDPADPNAFGADADKQGDDGPGDFTHDAATADTGTSPPAADAASDTGTFNGSGGCDSGLDGGVDGGVDGECTAGDAAPADAGGDAARDAADDTIADDAASASDGAAEGG